MSTWVSTSGTFRQSFDTVSCSVVLHSLGVWIYRQFIWLLVAPSARVSEDWNSFICRTINWQGESAEGIQREECRILYAFSDKGKSTLCGFHSSFPAPDCSASYPTEEWRTFQIRKFPTLWRSPPAKGRNGFFARWKRLWAAFSPKYPTIYGVRRGSPKKSSRRFGSCIEDF